MRFYALLFFVVALIAGLAGFNDLAPKLAGIARLVFYLFMGLGLASVVLSLPKR